MAIGLLVPTTTKVDCPASTAATRLVSTDSGKAYLAITIASDINNTGTLFIASTSALAVSEDAIAVLPGKSFDFGPVTTGGRVWGNIDASSLWVRSNAGTGDDIIFTYYVSQ